MTKEAVSPPKQIRTAFWNVQNLFDLDGSQVATELEYTAVFGWDRKLLDHRIQQTAGILNGLFEGQGPDLIGLCEVESERIAQRLLKELGRSDYRLISVPNPSFSALDTVLIYSDRIFQTGSEPCRGHVVDHRFPTCDILEAHLRTIDGDSDLMVWSITGHHANPQQWILNPSESRWPVIVLVLSRCSSSPPKRVSGFERQRCLALSPQSALEPEHPRDGRL